MRADARSPSPGVAILLRMREAAQVLAVSERTLWTLVARGEIPAVRYSRRCVRVRRADLEAWAAVRASTNREAPTLLARRRHQAGSQP